MFLSKTPGEAAFGKTRTCALPLRGRSLNQGSVLEHPKRMEKSRFVNKMFQFLNTGNCISQYFSGEKKPHDGEWDLAWGPPVFNVWPRSKLMASPSGTLPGTEFISTMASTSIKGQEVWSPPDWKVWGCWRSHVFKHRYPSIYDGFIFMLSWKYL